MTALSLNVGKTIHVQHDKDGRTAPGVRSHGSVPLSHSENVVTRIGLHTQTITDNSVDELINF